MLSWSPDSLTNSAVGFVQVYATPIALVAGFAILGAFLSGVFLALRSGLLPKSGLKDKSASADGVSTPRTNEGVKRK